MARTYINHGVSGSKDRRPALDEMMAKAKRRSFDAVAVVKLDRLAVVLGGPRALPLRS